MRHRQHLPLGVVHEVVADPLGLVRQATQEHLHPEQITGQVRLQLPAKQRPRKKDKNTFLKPTGILFPFEVLNNLSNITFNPLLCLIIHFKITGTLHHISMFYLIKYWLVYTNFQNYYINTNQFDCYLVMV